MYDQHSQAMAAERHWQRARRRAFWTQLLADTELQRVSLHDFNEIAQRLHLKTAFYRGVQNVPLRRVVGSVGRYQDFTGTFLPTNESMEQRWKHVAALYLDPTSGGAPPVELYKVGESYFVKDGNHRVSIANELGLPVIEAYVWEYPELAEGINAETDIDSVLLQVEYREFREQTMLDRLRPGHGIRLTEPGGYTDMLYQIEQLRAALSKIDEIEIIYEYAVLNWYDMIYETTVQSIEQEGILAQFPDRTPADFFIFVTRYKEALEAEYGGRVRVDDAAHTLRKRIRGTLVERLRRAALRLMARLATR